MLQRLASVALVAFTVPGAFIGIRYTILTRRHPRPRMPTVFGVVGFLLLIRGIWLIAEMAVRRGGVQ